jgi:GDPmannose 4,6-dehydratase
MIRRSSLFNTKRIDHLIDKITTHYGDMSDSSSINRLIEKIKPDEIYNLAAQSHVKVSFEIPYYTAQVDALGTLAILEAVKNHCPGCRIYQASTSELYGGMGYNMPLTGYNESSPMHPRSPYGVAKLYGLWITKNYRESYGMYISNGILFNHEGERRGETFVTRKITKALGVIKNYIDHEHFDFPTLKLGNLDAKRDWGYAKDFVEGMWMMLQAEYPDDYVLATGEAYSVREFIEEACKVSGLNITWVGSGVSEKAILDNGITIIEVDEKYYRPAEVSHLLGDSTKARNELGWNPKVRFKELVKIMMTHDIKNTQTP